MTITAIGNPTGTGALDAPWRPYVETAPPEYTQSLSIVSGKYRMTGDNASTGYHKTSMESAAVFGAGEVRATATLVSAINSVNEITLGAFSDPSYDAPYSNSPVNGYGLRINLNTSTVLLDKTTGETLRDTADVLTNTALAQVALGDNSFPAGTIIYMAIRADSTGLKGWVWRNSEPRPTAPTVSSTDTKYRSGEVRPSMKSGGPAVVSTIDWNGIVYDDLVTTVGSVLMTENFPTNGAWPTANWEAPVVAGSATATVVGNRGRFNVGHAGGYVDGAKVLAKSSLVPATTTDTDVTFVMAPVNSLSESYFTIALRSVSGASTGYGITQRGGDGQITFRVSGADAGGGYSPTGLPAYGVGIYRRLRVQVVGATTRYRAWADGAAEPSAWTREFTDPSATPIQAGRFAFDIGGGAPAVAGGITFDVDEITVSGVVPASSGPATPMAETVIFNDDCNKAVGVTPTQSGLYDSETGNDTHPWTYTGSGHLSMKMTVGAYVGRRRARTTYNASPDYQRIRTAFQYRGLEEKYPGVLFRSSGTPLYGGTDQAYEENAYYFSARPLGTHLCLERSDGATVAELVRTTMPAYVVGETVEMVCDSIRTPSSVTIKIKHWKRGQIEPTTGGADNDGFQIKYVDTTDQRKNGNRVSLFNGASNVGDDHWLDHLSVSHLVPVGAVANAGADQTVAAGASVTLVGTPAGGTWTQDSGAAATLSAPVSNGTDTRVTLTSGNISTTTAADRIFRYTVPDGGGTAATVTISDNFDRTANATTLNGVGAPASWIAQQGTWGITADGKAYSVTANDSDTATVDLSKINFDISAVLTRATSGWTGLVGGYESNFNTFILEIDGGSNLTVNKRLTGLAHATLFSLAAIAAEATIRFTRTGGNRLTVFVNGTQVWQSEPVHNDLQYTRVGIRHGSGAAGVPLRWDNFVAIGS